MLSLALGVGANTAMFGVVNAVLVRSLPFSHQERLVRIVASNRGVGARDIGLSVPEFDDLRSRADVFDQVAATFAGPTNLTGGERPERFELLEVSPNYFSMLGTSAQIGRVFGPGDEAPGFAEAAIISDSLWAREFGRDPGVLGRKIQLDNDPYTIVGVLPPGFRHPVSTVSTDVDIWVTWIQGRSVPEARTQPADLARNDDRTLEARNRPGAGAIQAGRVRVPAAGGIRHGLPEGVGRSGRCG